MKKRRLILFGVLAIIMATTAVFSACVVPARDIEYSERQVIESARAEKTLFYDNGKNFFVIDTSVSSGYSYAVFVAIAQKWVDEHPDKRIIAYDNPDRSYLWVVYYEDRK